MGGSEYGIDLTWCGTKIYREKTMKKRKYEITVIKADGTESIAQMDKQPDYQFLHDTINGYIERVEIEYKGKKWCNMWVDEEGLLKQLEFNPIATKLAREHARYKSDTEPDFYYIVGTVVIVRPYQVEV